MTDVIVIDGDQSETIVIQEKTTEVIATVVNTLHQLSEVTQTVVVAEVVPSVELIAERTVVHVIRDYVPRVDVIATVATGPQGPIGPQGPVGPGGNPITPREYRRLAQAGVVLYTLPELPYGAIQVKVNGVEVTHTLAGVNVTITEYSPGSMESTDELTFHYFVED